MAESAEISLRNIKKTVGAGALAAAAALGGSIPSVSESHAAEANTSLYTLKQTLHNNPTAHALRSNGADTFFSAGDTILEIDPSGKEIQTFPNLLGITPPPRIYTTQDNGIVILGSMETHRKDWPAQPRVTYIVSEEESTQAAHTSLTLHAADNPQKILYTTQGAIIPSGVTFDSKGKHIFSIISTAQGEKMTSTIHETTIAPNGTIEQTQIAPNLQAVYDMSVDAKENKVLIMNTNASGQNEICIDQDGKETRIPTDMLAHQIRSQLGLDTDPTVQVQSGLFFQDTVYLGALANGLPVVIAYTNGYSYPQISMLPVMDNTFTESISLSTFNGIEPALLTSLKQTQNNHPIDSLLALTPDRNGHMTSFTTLSPAL